MINEELISAYLDGELTAEEQAQVEQALAADARLRRMHDDLRSLRSRLQAMPRHKLDADFANRVLSAAKEAREADTQVDVLVATHHGQQTIVERAQHEPLAWRVVVWSVASLAALILVVLLLPRSVEIADVPRERRVATNQQAETGEQERAQAKIRDDRAELRKQTETLEVDKLATQRHRAIDEGAELRKAEALEREESQADSRPDRRASGDHTGRTAEAKAAAKSAFPGRPEASKQQHFGGGHGLGQANAMQSDRQDGLRSAVAGTKAAVLSDDQVVVVRLRREVAKAKSSLDDVLSGQGIALQDAARTKSRGMAVEKTDNADRKTDKALESEQASTAIPPDVRRFAAAEANREVIYLEASTEQVAATLARLESDAGYQLTMSSLDEFEQLRKKESSAAKGDGAAAAPAAPPRADQAAPSELQPSAAMRARTFAADAASTAEAAANGQAPQRDGSNRSAEARPNAPGFAKRLTAGNADARELQRPAAAASLQSEGGTPSAAVIERRNADLASAAAQPLSEADASAGGEAPRVRLILVIEE